MTSQEQIFAKLNDSSEPLASRKQLLLEHVRQQLKECDEQPKLRRDAAYKIAGLMATATAQSLDDDDPYMQILLMAGQLELPKEQRSDNASWEELEQQVDSLL